MVGRAEEVEFLYPMVGKVDEPNHRGLIYQAWDGISLEEDNLDF